ncbi:MAG: hypothetical protein GC200_06070 [Tepidisphaera sp.]|nr:hypothetical protein [Tepidisphaera sp.]
MPAKRILRRLAIGLGAAMLVGGLGALFGVHEHIHLIVSFGKDDPALHKQVLDTFKGGVLLASLGAALIGFALPAPSPPRQ